jgi:hypothetical protein
MSVQEQRQALFVTIFSTAVAVFYALSDVYRWPLFSYYPATGLLAWGWAPSTDNDGPAMYWYGWVATTVLLSALLALVASRWIRSTRSGLWHLSWLVPLIMVPVMAYTLKVYWR